MPILDLTPAEEKESSLLLLGGGVADTPPKIKKTHGPRQGLPASPWPGASQVLPTLGGRDSGRLGLSVRTWLAEAATAADLKGGVWMGFPPPRKKKFKLVFGCLNLGEDMNDLVPSSVSALEEKQDEAQPFDSVLPQGHA